MVSPLYVYSCDAMVEINNVVSRLLHTDLGKTFVSMILGIGLATLFRKVCNDKSCINFNGPILKDFSQIEKKTYKHGNKCYKYKITSAPCDPSIKKVIPLSDKEKESFTDSFTTDMHNEYTKYNSISN